MLLGPLRILVGRLQLDANEGPPARVPIPLSDGRAGAHRGTTDVHESVEEIIERGRLALVAVEDEHEVLRLKRVREVKEGREILSDVGNASSCLLRHGMGTVRVVGAKNVREVRSARGALGGDGGRCTKAIRPCGLSHTNPCSACDGGITISSMCERSATALAAVGKTLAISGRTGSQRLEPLEVRANGCSTNELTGDGGSVIGRAGMRTAVGGETELGGVGGSQVRACCCACCAVAFGSSGLPPLASNPLPLTGNRRGAKALGSTQGLVGVEVGCAAGAASTSEGEGGLLDRRRGAEEPRTLEVGAARRLRIEGQVGVAHVHGSQSSLSGGVVPEA